MFHVLSGLLYERFTVNCFNLVKNILLCDAYRMGKLDTGWLIGLLLGLYQYNIASLKKKLWEYLRETKFHTKTWKWVKIKWKAIIIDLYENI